MFNFFRKKKKDQLPIPPQINIPEIDKSIPDIPDIEAGLNLINTFSEEANDENYFSREDVTTPNEQTVMNVAGSWSVDRLFFLKEKI
jgi:hypothetical protein